MPAPFATVCLAFGFLLDATGHDGMAVAFGVIAVVWQSIIFLTRASADAP